MHREGYCNVQTTTSSVDKFHMVCPNIQIDEEQFGNSKRSKIHGNKKAKNYENKKKSVKSN